MNKKDIVAFQNEIAKKERERSDAELQGWLGLDTWTADEGLLLLVGIDPGAAVVEWGGWVSGYGCKVNKVRIRNARPLSRHPVFLTIPTPKSPQFGADEVNSGHLTVSYDVPPDAQEEEMKWEKLAILQELDEKLSGVHKLWKSGQHNAQRYPVAYFIEWAEKKHVEIPWLSYAREREWLIQDAEDAATVVQGATDDKQVARVGRPPTIKMKAEIVRQIVIATESVADMKFDIGALPGNAADLLDACQRIVWSVAGKKTMRVTIKTFKGWLRTAGYSFPNGRAPKDQATFWTRLAPTTIPKIKDEVFRVVFP